MSTRHTDWDSAPIVEVYRPTCPSCGSESYSPIRGWRDGDGSRTSRRMCKACGAAYVVMSEPLPSSGKCELGELYDHEEDEL